MTKDFIENKWPWNFTSTWQFPPALPLDFSIDWMLKTMGTVNVTEGPIDELLEVIQRVDRRDEWTFGSEEVEVHVGDVMQPSWNGTENRTVNLNCLVCSEGRTGQSQQEGTGVFDACSNWQDTSHRSTFYSSMTMVPPGSNLTFPPLSNGLEIPEQAVGLCMFSLSAANGFASIDSTYPFPVIQKPRLVHHRFNAAYTFGTEDPSIPDATVTATPTAAFPTAASQVKYDGANKGMIVGVIVGVLVVVALLAFGLWLIWRRGGVRNPGARSGNTRTAENQEVELTHRPVGDDEDIPPPYHEVVKL